MKNFVKMLQEKAGYVSIETVIIAGLMLALGTFAVSQLYTAGQTVTADAIARVENIATLDPDVLN